MNAGELSEMLRAGDEAVFVYVEAKEIPEIGDDNEDLTQAESWLKRFSAYISSQSVMGELDRAVYAGRPPAAGRGRRIAARSLRFPQSHPRAGWLFS